MSSPLNDRLAGTLAAALARSPRANLQQIAQNAGISRATLYRISPNRDALVELLLERATEHLQSALINAKLDTPPYLDALQRLTEHVVANRNFFMFWNAAQYVQMIDSKDDEQQLMSFYGDALDEFFLRGQKAGVFWIDLQARWLTKAYYYLLYAAVDAAERGEIASVGMASTVLKTLVQGVGDQERNPTVAAKAS